MKKHPVILVPCHVAAYPETCGVKLPKVEMYRDAIGFYWCEEHKHRGALATWAHLSKYPFVECEWYSGCTPYAFGFAEDFSASEMMWRVQITTAPDDAIWAAISAIGSDDTLIALLGSGRDYSIEQIAS